MKQVKIIKRLVGLSLLLLLPLYAQGVSYPTEGLFSRHIQEKISPMESISDNPFEIKTNEFGFIVDGAGLLGEGEEDEFPDDDGQYNPDDHVYGTPLGGLPIMLFLLLSIGYGVRQYRVRRTENEASTLQSNQ